MNRKLSNLTKKFGLKVKIERIKKNLSIEELAELANLNRNSISAIENGKSTPTLETVNLIAKALGIKLADLVDIDKIEL
jgi:transcriptional regulator with XRE-family HTH domain